MRFPHKYHPNYFKNFYFRIQSDCLEAFPLILERLIEVTLSLDAAAKQEKGLKPIKSLVNKRTLSIVATPSMPIADILHRIDVHHETQENIRKQMVSMKRTL